jgi:hypothetical protein
MATTDQPYTLTRVAVETPAAAIAAVTATDTFTAAAHGLANGARVMLTSLGSMTNVALLTGYYVVTSAAGTFKIAATRGGTAIVVGVGAPSVWAITETDLQWPNKVAIKGENKDITWEGGNMILKRTQILGYSLDIDLDCVPISAHRVIFNKAAMTVLPGGYTSGTGIGGGLDASGVSCGVFTEGYEIKNINGVPTTIPYRQWYPVGTLAIRQAGGQQTGGKDDMWGYTFTALKTTVDILGVTIPNVAADGDFFIKMN